MNNDIWNGFKIFKDFGFLLQYRSLITYVLHLSEFCLD